MLGFDVNKDHLELGSKEIGVIAGKAGRASSQFYLVDAEYSERLKFLAFTRKIYEIQDIHRKNCSQCNGDDGGYDDNAAFTKKMIIDLNRINKFSERRAHLLPEGHPSMTHPRLARAMVNISGAKKEVYDPFCGAGGILIEGGLCGLKVFGSDIDRIMLSRAEINLDSLFIGNYALFQQDAAGFKGKYEAVVTDLPYGRTTKINKCLDELYLSFMHNLKNNKIKKIVVGFPDFVNHKRFIKKAGFRIASEFDYYLHKSLSKKIVILS